MLSVSANRSNGSGAARTSAGREEHYGRIGTVPCARPFSISLSRSISKERAMTRKNMKEADLPDTDNPGQDSQTANAIRNQSTVKPEDYPEKKGRAAKEPSGPKSP